MEGLSNYYQTYNLDEFKKREERLKKNCDKYPLKDKREHFTFIRGLVANPDLNPKHYRNKDIICLIGGTGAGKSSLFALMTDSNAVKVEEGSFNHPLVSSGSQPNTLFLNYAFINKDDAYQQMIPNHQEMSSDKEHMVLMDLPGFNDTRGFSHGVSINLLFKSIFQEAESVRLGFLVTEGAFSANPSQEIIETIQETQNFFGEQDIEDMSFLVIS